MRMTPELSFAAAEPVSSVSSNRRSDAASSSAFVAVDPWHPLRDREAITPDIPSADGEITALVGEQSQGLRLSGLSPPRSKGLLRGRPSPT